MFMTEKSSVCALLCTMIPWSLADGTRYAYYIYHNKIIAALRFNLFIVLYVVGVFLGEEVLML